MKKYIISISLLFALGMSACNDFLDTLPDTRSTIKSTEDARKLLISAYPDKGINWFAELLSDNVNEVSENESWGNNFQEELFYYADPTEINNDAPQFFWSSSWDAIYTSNVAIDELNKQPDSAEKRALLAEAKLIRAYNHFMLLNVYAHSYNPKYADTDLGIPIMEEPVKDIKAKKDRKSVAEVYAFIDKDLQEALPNISDDIYKAPKFHFNKKAAYAFATRFYLFYQKWDKVEEYAAVVFEGNPQGVLRDWTAITKTPDDWTQRGLTYVNTDAKSNFLLLNCITNLPQTYGFFKTDARFNHNTQIGEGQTLYANGAWGALKDANLKYAPVTLTNPFAKLMYPKYPEQFEITNQLAFTGYRHTTYVALSGDEVLLSRAEALIMQGKYDEALSDMNLWLSNFTVNLNPLTDKSITDWFVATEYYTNDNPTAKKKFNADFNITSEKQEAYLQVCLHMRRIQTLHEGLRWFDVKRYGIEIQRYVITSGKYNKDIVKVAPLLVRDERRALQLPVDVIASGMKRNPR